MGVPAFFKWLCMRCPKILHDVIDDIPPELIDDEEYLNHPQLEIDNFYLDMNGIIHPCTHPEHLPIPKPLNEEEMFNNIYKYLDKLMKMVKPRKLVYFAVDGVAPRAKMNQQRGRRFKAAQESLKIIEKKEQLKQEWRERGQDYPEELEQDFNNKFDSNVITPGTEFMDRMSKAVQYYIVERMNKDPLFKDVKCIFSDANIPGEGEHKVLDFVRQQRALEGYDPNTKHCLYGADADLIMLGLSTHEPYFYILRETVMTKKEIKETSGEATQQTEGEFHEKAKKEIPIHFQFIKLYAFREYLDYEFKYLQIPFEYDLEKVIDDFVFMCFFVGNDFLPHMPCLTIRDGGIDSLMYLYKRNLPLMGGYFVENGNLNLMRVDLILREVGQIEEALLANAAREQENRKNRQRGGRGGGRGGRRDGGNDRNSYRNDRDGGYNRSDSRGYGRDDRGGYGRDDRGGYGRDDRGYSGDNRGYNNGNRGYDRGGYNDRGYSRDDRNDRGYDRDGGRDRYNRSDSREDRNDRYGRDDNRGYRGDNRDYGRDDRGYRGGRDDERDRRRDDDREERKREEERGRDDREQRSVKNRAAADLFKSQIANSMVTEESKQKQETPDLKGSSESVMGKAKEEPTKTAAKTETAVSLDDWGRSADETEEQTQAASETVKPTSPTTVTQEPSTTIKSPEQISETMEEDVPKPPTFISDSSDVLVSEPSKVEGDQAKKVEEDPRKSFNLELNEKIKDDSKGDETLYDPRKSGFKETYYFEKFKVMPHEFPEFQKLIRKAYCEALCWVFAYYYKGCISWEWYYPFHYTPFAADIAGLDKVDVQFETGTPFKPMEQLLAVLPPYSAKAVPACLRSLMTEDDSEIIDFYPKDFYVDIKGKRFAWMGEVILPFIDQDRLLRAISKKAHNLTPQEARRNQLNKTLVYVKRDSQLINTLTTQFPNAELTNPETNVVIEYGEANIGGGILGLPQKYKLDHDYTKPFPCEAVGEVTQNQVITLAFDNPPYKPHISKILQGVHMPDALYTEETFAQVDRRFFAGAKTIRLIERTLGVFQENPNGGGFRGFLNSGPQGIATSYGMHHPQSHLYNYNTSFNNNRAVERGPSQFKRHSYTPYPPNYQQGNQPPPGMPPPGALNQMNPMNQMHPPMNPPMNQMGPEAGGFQFNQQQNYMQMPPRNNNFAPPPNQQLQNTSNPFNLLQKRDQPSGRNQDDQQYGDQTRKQLHK